jgi:hypothetical protein
LILCPVHFHNSRRHLITNFNRRANLPFTLCCIVRSSHELCQRLQGPRRGPQVAAGVYRSQCPGHRQPHSTSSPDIKIGFDEHHNDRSPRFQKLDFPRYDGKTDPHGFINRCELYFHQPPRQPSLHPLPVTPFYYSITFHNLIGASDNGFLMSTTMDTR